MEYDSLELYSLILKLQSICETSGDKKFNKEILSVKSRILFLIYQYKQISPTTLVEELKMAKSNVALFCKKLLQEQLIISKQDKLDKRVIYYCLTKKGQKVITNNLKTISDKIVLSSSQSNLKNISKSTKMLYESISKLGV